MSSRKLVHYSPEAVDQLEHIYEYIRDFLFNVSAARKVISRIRNDVKQLSLFPELGKLLIGRHDYVPRDLSSVRYLICGDYLALYEYDNEVITVLNIFHGSNDIQGHILEMSSYEQE